MSKKLLTIFSLLLIFFAMSCNKNSTDPTANNNSKDPTAPLKDSQYVGKWYKTNSNDRIIEIKQDGSIDWFDQTEQPAASASGTNVKKEGDAVFKAAFLKNGETNEFVFTFTSDAAGSMAFQGNPPYTYQVVKK